MAEIKTDKKVQSAIIGFFKTALEKKSVKIITSSRGPNHLRINYTGNVETLLNSIVPVKIELTDVVISGTYQTHTITLKKDITGAKAGDSCYLVIAVRSQGVLTTKELNPDTLALGGKEFTKSNFYASVENAVKKSKAPDNIKTFLMQLMDASKTESGTIKTDLLESISDSDLNIIAKDFGELSGAYWYMNVHNPKTTKIKYPAGGSFRLVDYFAYEGNKQIAISAKANEGAPPSIDAIADVLKTMKYGNSKQEGARKAIIAISENSVVDGIVEAAKNLNTEGYDFLKKNIFNNKDFSAADCENIMQGYGNAEAAMLAFDKYYKLIGRAASKDITQRIFANKAKRWGLILSPLGYYVVDVLNSDKTYLSVLNDAAKKIEVTQIYMKINKSSKKVSYMIKEFSESDFQFMYNANAGNPGLKKISFKMKK